MTAVFACVQITAFKSFFVSLNLPYSVKRGEEFALQVTVFNYLTIRLSVNCMQLSLATAHSTVIILTSFL